MDVKYICVEKHKLDTVDRVPGQLIAIQDQPGCYYDMPNGSNPPNRFLISAYTVVDDLPAVSAAKDDLLYVVTGESHKGIYFKADNKLVCLSSENTDINVKTTKTSAGKIYLAGPKSTSTSGVTGGIYNIDSVYVDAVSGELYANKVVGTATEAEHATAADKATNDSKSQPITGYLRNVTVSGTSITFTLGDGTTTSITTQDTHHQAKLVVTDSATGKENKTVTSGPAYLNVIENGEVRSSNKISASAGATINVDTYGNIVISSKWDSNSKTASGYVAKGEGNVNKVWGTDDEGNPNWIEYSGPIIPGSEGNYTKVSVDRNGRVISGSAPHTLEGLGITDGGHVRLANVVDLNSSYYSEGMYLSLELTGYSIPSFPNGVDRYEPFVLMVMPTRANAETSEVDKIQMLYSSDPNCTDGLFTFIRKYYVATDTWSDWEPIHYSDTVYTHPNDPGNYHLPIGGESGQLLVNDGTSGNGRWASLSSMAAFNGASAQADGLSGLVPKPVKGDEGKVLFGDGSWREPTDTEYEEFTGLTSQDGASGLVPGPKTTDAGKFLSAFGDWEMVKMRWENWEVDGPRSVLEVAQIADGASAQPDGDVLANPFANI